MMSRKILAGLAAGLVLVGTQAAVAGQNEFCEGFNRGYLEGYKRAGGSIFQPSVPLCPLMPRKTPRDPRDDGEHGYEVGYDMGQQEARRRFN